MIRITADPTFARRYKKWVKRHPDLAEVFERKLETFAEDPFAQTLRTHQLAGNLKGRWAFSITHDHRLIFRFENDREEAVLITIGSHDEVY